MGVALAAITLVLASGAAVLAYRIVDPVHTPLMTLRALERGDALPARLRWRPLSQISPHLMRAVIASEDANFCKKCGANLHEDDAPAAATPGAESRDPDAPAADDEDIGEHRREHENEPRHHSNQEKPPGLLPGVERHCETARPRRGAPPARFVNCVNPGIFE